ncbi:ras association domain-containing protein 8-like [Haliotis asinina]|uniref:ras association domain-containing protein 8-like n=1 Tax=Haliotis asinina TaxID=109174 RepID=UPI0035319538
MMELKVWVDGIQRVVCGVTVDTTCQDVVIALAHSMGRTGRFTLIEKWRDVERPLTPGEHPLRVLHKWGEYSSEVKLFLCQSETEKLKQRDRHKQPDRFTHNFSPPKTQSENVIKRNLTFSGAHNISTSRTSLIPGNLKRGTLLENGISPRSSSHSSSSSTRSSPHPVPAPRQHSPGNIPKPAPRHSPLHNGQIPALPSKPSVVRQPPSRSINNLSPANHQLSVSAFDQHRGRSPSPNTHRRNSPSPSSYGRGSSIRHRLDSPSPSRHGTYSNLNTLTAEEHNIDSPRHSHQGSTDLEEYDLDINFPDILRDSQCPERSAVHTEYRLDDPQNSQPEPEKAKLLRLVSMQKERLKVQESQLDVIETEIVSLEEKESEYESNFQKLTNELVQLEQREHDDEVELTEISSIQWIDVLDVAQKTETRLNGEINDLKERLGELETQLSSQQVRLTELESEVVTAQKAREEREKEAERVRLAKEAQCKTDIEDVNKELQKVEEEQEKGKKELEELEGEIAKVEKLLKVKETEFEGLEGDLKKVNLQEFGSQSLSPTLGKSADSGEAVLKILEGRLSPRPSISPSTPTQQAFINALASKNPNGVWV